MDFLEYYAIADARGPDCAADESIHRLEREGLVTVEDTGWGVRRVRLTTKGKQCITRAASAGTQTERVLQRTPPEHRTQRP